MRDAIVARLETLAPDWTVDVSVVYDPPWTSDRISAAGRRSLAASGFAPPVAGGAGIPVRLDAPAACPWCGSNRTVLENAFGPTACRSIRYCTACRQPFEQFKPV